MKYLVDSNIIIYHLNNEPIATRFLVDSQADCAISQITYIEVLSFEFSEEEEFLVKKLLEKFNILDVNQKIAINAVKNRKLKKIRLPDNIILSTAQVNNLILVTRNLDDFKFFEVEILNPFEIQKNI
jgi:predicted nucleic acid-binding protein